MTTITAQPATAEDTCPTCGGAITIGDETAVPNTETGNVVHYGCLQCAVCGGTQADDDLDLQENGGRWQVVVHTDLDDDEIVDVACSDECAHEWREARSADDRDTIEWFESCRRAGIDPNDPRI